MSNQFEYHNSALHTRESSTLVIATVASSASLVLLGFTYTENQFSSILNWIGFFFPLLGFVYREITIWSVDQVEYQIIRKLLQKKWYQRPKWVNLLGFFRGFILRILLLLPSYLWILKITIIDVKLNNYSISILIIFLLICFIFSIIEWCIRGYFESTDNNKIKTVNDEPKNDRSNDDNQKMGVVVMQPVKNPDDFFEIAIAILAILSAGDLAYYLEILGTPPSINILRLFTYPFVILFGFWLFNEVFIKNISSQLRIVQLSIVVRDLCWSMWSNLLSLYLLFIFGASDIKLSFIILALSVILYGFIMFGYSFYSRSKDIENYNRYFKNLFWYIEKIVVYFIGYCGIALFLFLFPF